MKHIVPRTVMAATFLCSLALPARADIRADVRTKVEGAMKSAKSYVVTTSDPAQAYLSTIVYVAPDRSRVAVAIAANTTDVVNVGNTSYSSKNGAPFEKLTVTPEERTQLTSIGQVKVGAIHSDISVDGVTYGAFETTVPLAAVVMLTCTYNKKTFRLVRCANNDVTRTYLNYDDPENIVETPQNIVEPPKGST